MEKAALIGTTAYFLAAEHAVPQPSLNFLDYGLLGLIAIFLLLSYKLAETWMKKKIDDRDRNGLPEHTNRSVMDYSEQLARVVYDTSKVLSEVSVGMQKHHDILVGMNKSHDKIIESVSKGLEILMKHDAETSEFIKNYKSMVFDSFKKDR